MTRKLTVKDIQLWLDKLALIQSSGAKVVHVKSLLSQYESEKQQELVKILEGFCRCGACPINEEKIDKAVEKVRGKS